MMTQGQFLCAVCEHLFVQGINCSELSLLEMLAQQERDRLGTWPDPVAFANQCLELPDVTEPAVAPPGAFASTTAGACERWLAVHEAGHAIVGLDAGFALFGVRFFGNDGFPGEAGFEDHEWERSEDQELLRRLIRVDVAGNVAETLYPDLREREGRLSAFYAYRTSGDRPLDFIYADDRAKRLVRVQFEVSGRSAVSEDTWAARQAIVEQAESEAEQALQNARGSLDRLADQLQLGPMTGAQVRLLVGCK